MENTQAQPTATAFMRLTAIKFDRVIPAHVLAGINAGYEQRISTSPVLRIRVSFHQSGEPCSVAFRLNGYSLGSYCALSGFRPGAFMHFSPEVVAYLSQAADEALAIVAPLVITH